MFLDHVYCISCTWFIQKSQIYHSILSPTYSLKVQTGNHVTDGRHDSTAGQCEWCQSFCGSRGLSLWLRTWPSELPVAFWLSLVSPLAQAWGPFLSLLAQPWFPQALWCGLLSPGGTPLGVATALTLGLVSHYRWNGQTQVGGSKARKGEDGQSMVYSMCRLSP